jgi:F-type H+-transporting ATPase subunit delta
MIGSAARRYAKALFSLARDQNALEKTAADLHRLTAIANDPRVRPVLTNPMLAPSRRRDLAELMFKETSPSEIVARFVRLLADRQRLGDMAAIAREFDRLLDQHSGQTRMIVRAPMPLTPAQQQEIVATFERLTKKKVLPSFEVDPGLLGGVVVEAEGRVYDGSLKTQFERLAKQMSGTAH